MSQPRELAPFQVTRTIIASAAPKIDESAAAPILPLMLIGPTTPDAFKGLPHMRDLAPVPELPRELCNELIGDGPEPRPKCGHPLVNGVCELHPVSSDEAVEDDPKVDAGSSATSNAYSSETEAVTHPSFLSASQVENASAAKDVSQRLPPLL